MYEIVYKSTHFRQVCQLLLSLIVDTCNLIMHTVKYA